MSNISFSILNMSSKRKSSNMVPKESPMKIYSIALETQEPSRIRKITIEKVIQ